MSKQLLKKSLQNFNTDFHKREEDIFSIFNKCDIKNFFENSLYQGLILLK